MKTLFLTVEEVKEAIVNYYNQELNDDIESEVDNETYIEDCEVVTKFYIKDHYKKENRTTYFSLSHEDLVEVFDNYLKDSNYELDRFEYMGGIRHVGYFVSEDTPYFEGIILFLREKSLKKKRKLF